MKSDKNKQTTTTKKIFHWPSRERIEMESTDLTESEPVYLAWAPRLNMVWTMHVKTNPMISIHFLSVNVTKVNFTSCWPIWQSGQIILKIKLSSTDSIIFTVDQGHWKCQILSNKLMLHLYSAFLGTQSSLHSKGISPQLPPMCIIHR